MSDYDGYVDPATIDWQEDDGYQDYDATADWCEENGVTEEPAESE